MQILRPFKSLGCMALKSALPNPKKTTAWILKQFTGDKIRD